MINTREIAKEYRLTHWTQIMKERNESGLSIKMYCEQQGIALNTYFYWQRKLREAACRQMIQETQALTETSIATKRPTVSTERYSPMPVGWAVCAEDKRSHESSGISIEIGNSRISVTTDANLKFLVEVCRALTAL